MGNDHPAVMFEIMARDQVAMRKFYSTVFGWTYAVGKSGFCYVTFPASRRPLLGGIGQASQEPGEHAGTNFYLQVSDLDDTLRLAEENGGSTLLPAQHVDDYRFAMFKDPEGNVIGLIEPFKDSQATR